MTINDNEFIKAIYDDRIEVDEDIRDELEERRGILSEMKETLQKVYPDRWDISLRENSSGNIDPSIVIWFPEITIANKVNEQHVIRDMFISLSIRRRMGLYPFIKGVRATVTIDELKTGYQHSHLQRINRLYDDNNYLGFSPFCLGDGIIDQTLKVLYEFDRQVFEMFLYQLSDYLGYEAIEGSRHAYISDINRKLLDYPPTPFHEVYDRFMSDGSIPHFPVRFIRGPLVNRIEVVNDHNIEKAVTLLCARRFPECLVHKTTDGVYFTNTNTKQSDRNYRDKYKNIDYLLTFRGEDIHFRVEGRSITKNTKKYAHPDITKYIAAKLSEEITEFAANTYKPGRKSNSKHITGNVKQDTVPVQ